MVNQKTAFIYSRKSIKPKGIFGDKESIAYQEQVMEGYCEIEGLVIERRFSDIGYSGTHLKRPELLELLECLENNEYKADVLLFYSVDRLGRDFRNNIDLILRVGELVEEVIFVAENMKKSHEHFKLFLVFKSIMAEEERIILLKKLNHGRKARPLFHKKFLGAHKPLGYVQREDGRLVLATLKETTDITEVHGLEIVQFIYLAYLFNFSMRQIAKQLDKKYGLTRRDREWSTKAAM